jgi:monoamine oxidase
MARTPLAQWLEDAGPGIVVIGAGLAGLACADALRQAGYNDFQGYVNGAVETGQRAAGEILAALK